MKRSVSKMPQSARRNRQAFGLLMATNLAFLLIGMGLILFLHHIKALPFEDELPSSPQAAARTASVTSQSPAWGILEVTPIMLEQPEEYFSHYVPPPKNISWFFPRRNPEQLLDLFKACDLPEEHLRALADSTRWKVAPQGIWVDPPLDVVRDLPAASRQKLYEVLAESPENQSYGYPFHYRKDGFQEWFAQSGLPEKTIRLIEQMTYIQNGRLRFADIQYLHMTLPPQEVLAVSRTLSRTPSLIINLRINPETDLKNLLAYWGTETSLRRIKPLLESVKRLPEGGRINAAWFFPAVPRLHVYTYPSPTNSAVDKPQDCFWTAMNFFNDEPDDRFLDPRYVARVLKNEFRTVPKAGRFGDLILYFRPLQPDASDIEMVHMCVYIADDIVFTKNGRDPRQPWVLMRLSDMLVHYPAATGPAVAIFRRNNWQL